MASPSRDLACPDCRDDLDPRQRKGVEIDVCTGCLGIWLDRGELARLAGGSVGTDEAGEEPAFGLDPMASVGVRPCPVCGVAMARDEDPGSEIVLDRCPDHGIWLDAGELEAIRTHRADLPRPTADTLERSLSRTQEREVDPKTGWIASLLLVDTRLD